MVSSQTDNVLTITFTDDEMTVINWLRDTNSAVDIQTTLNQFLLQRHAQMNETDKNDAWDQLKDYPDVLQFALAEVSKRVLAKGIIIKPKIL